MKMELIQCSETSAIRTQMPGNYPKENILHISSTSKARGLALGHTKPPIKWASEFFPGVRI